MLHIRKLVVAPPVVVAVVLSTASREATAAHSAIHARAEAASRDVVHTVIDDSEVMSVAKCTQCAPHAGIFNQSSCRSSVARLSTYLTSCSASAAVRYAVLWGGRERDG